MTDLQDEAKKFIEQNHFTSWTETLAAFAERERGKIADELCDYFGHDTGVIAEIGMDGYIHKLRGEPNE